MESHQQKQKRLKRKEDDAMGKEENCTDNTSHQSRVIGQVTLAATETLGIYSNADSC